MSCLLLLPGNQHVLTLLIKAFSRSADGKWPCETAVRQSSKRPSSEAISIGDPSQVEYVLVPL